MGECVVSDGRFLRALGALCLGAALMVVAGCSRQGAAGQAAVSPVVELVAVEQRDVPVYAEWIGSLDGMVNADIRAQVTGYLQRQAYREGSFVRKGQLLFEIDPRPFEASLLQVRGQLSQAKGQLAQAHAQLSQAQAQLVKAEADQKRAQLDADRYTPMEKGDAVSQQEVDNAVQNNLSAKAQVRAATAQVETAKAQIEAANAAVEAGEAAVEAAKVNLSFTKLTAPIDGVAGQAQIQIGNLVSPAAGAVTTVSTLDPMRVYFTVSEQEYLAFARSSDGAGPEAAMQRFVLELILADGSVYPEKGKFYFADRHIDPNTGAMQLAGLFPNRGNLLRPGQYAKVRALIRTEKGALLIPQRAVIELQGGFQVAVVDSENKVTLRAVKPGEVNGSMWVIREGLHAGEKVVAEGGDRLRPGMTVSPKGA